MERTRNWGRVYRLKKQPPITLFHAGALFWRALNSDVWAFTLTIITLLLVGWRPLTWFVFMRPGSRDLARELATVVFATVCLLHVANTTAYHMTARRWLTAPIQRAALKKLMRAEVALCSLGAVTLIIFWAAGATASHEVDGVQVLSGFVGTWMPVTGVLSVPMLVLAIVTWFRKRVVPKIGDDVFSFVYLQKSLVLNLVTGAVTILYVLVVAVLLLSRFAEFGFPGRFNSRVPFEIEARLAGSQLVMAEPRSADDIGDFAAALAASGAPLRLAAADMRAPSGDIIAWESPDMSLGHVARLVEVSIPIHVHPTLVGSPQSLPGPGIHSSTSGGAISGAEQHPPSDARTARLVFSADPLFTAIAAWDPVVAALFALACALAVLSSSSSRALFSPLSAALSSLTEAAAVLGDDGRVLRQGRVTTRGDADTLAVGQAVKRVLANLSLSSRATGRSEYPHGGASTPDKLPPMRSLSSSPSLSRSRSILAPPGALPRSLSKGPQASIAVPPGAAAGSVSQSQSLRAELESAGSTHKPPRSGRVFPIGAPDKPGASRDDTDTWTVEGLGKGRGREGREDVVESFTDSLERSKHSMKFTPAVLNKLGSTSWNANVLGRDELVSACHLMFIKLRVPESICTRERFVAFAERALERHPEMRFHNKRRALGNMHAAFSALRLSDFSGMDPFRCLAVLVASLCMDLGSIGREYDDLCREGHPLAITYAFDRPQKQAAVAEVFRIASEEDCNVFAALGPRDVARLRGLIRTCILVTSPSALRPLESQLTVRKSQLMLSAAEATMAPRDGSRRRASVEGAVHAMIESGSVPPIGTDAPDTAMEAVMVMAAVHQGWSGSAKWRAEERRCLQQLLNPVGSVPDCSGEAVSRMQELWAHRKELWTSSIVPFMHALSAVCPSVAPYASEVDTVVSLPDAFAPAHGRLETPRELLSSPIA